MSDGGLRYLKTSSAWTQYYAAFRSLARGWDGRCCADQRGLKIDELKTWLAVFREAGALLKGTSSLPSGGPAQPVFLQNALVFLAALDLSERLMQGRWPRKEALTATFGEGFDVVAGPAVGGYHSGLRAGAHLKARAILRPKRVDGEAGLTGAWNFAIAEGRARTDVRGIRDDRALSFARQSRTGPVARAKSFGRSVALSTTNGKADGAVELVSLAAVDFPDYAARFIDPAAGTGRDRKAVEAHP